MELSGTSGRGNAYVAVAFAPYAQMMDAEVYFCTGLTFQSTVIQARHIAPVVELKLPVGCRFCEMKD